METISVIICALCLIISSVILIMFISLKGKFQNTADKASVENISKKQDDTTRYISEVENRISTAMTNSSMQTSNDFSALRAELQASQSNQRQELAKNIEEMRNQIMQTAQNMNEANTKILQLVSQSLDSMQKTMAESLEKTRITVEQRLESIEKSQAESLEKTKTTVEQKLESIQKSQTESLEKTRVTVEQRLQSIEKSQAESLEKSRATVEEKLAAMQKVQTENLDKIRETVDEKLSKTLSERLGSSFKTVSEQLENVYKSLGEVKELSTGVTSLNRVFSNVKARGTWAEVQLENILEQTIPGMYERNFKPDPTSGKIVEFAIKIPSQNDKDKVAYLPVDSKFPIEDYLRIVEASDVGDNIAVAEAKKALDARIINQAKEINKYIKEPVTLPFAIMYLATEGLYCEAINSKSGVVERCQNEYNVMIAGPSTITALLNSLALGFKAVAINEKTEEIRRILAIAKKQYDTFEGDLEKVRKYISQAGESIDKAVKRNGIIVKKLKGVESYESPIDILELPEET